MTMDWTAGNMGLESLMERGLFRVYWGRDVGVGVGGFENEKMDTVYTRGENSNR